jgi:hypothetical protein
MSHQRQSSGLRLEVEHEASALISMWGAQAGFIALQRAEEASDQRLMTDWDNVALRIARKSDSRPSLLGRFLHQCAWRPLCGSAKRGRGNDCVVRRQLWLLGDR